MHAIICCINRHSGIIGDMIHKGTDFMIDKIWDYKVYVPYKTSTFISNPR